MILEAEPPETAASPKFAETVQRSLPRPLTEAEIAQKAHDAAECEKDARDKEGKLGLLKTREKTLKEGIATNLSEARELLQAVDTGTVYEWIDCGVVKDVRSNRRGVIRADTGEVIEVSEITARERNMLIEDAVAPEPTPEQLAALDAWEKEHGRMPAQGDPGDEDPEDDEDDEDDPEAAAEDQDADADSEGDIDDGDENDD